MFQLPASTDIPLEDLSIDALLAAATAQHGDPFLQQLVATLAIIIKKAKNGEELSPREVALIPAIQKIVLELKLEHDWFKADASHYIVKIEALCSEAQDAERQAQYQNAIHFYNQALTIITQVVQGVENGTIKMNYRLALNPLDYCRQHQIKILIARGSCNICLNGNTLAAMRDYEQALTIPCANFLILASLYFERGLCNFLIERNSP